jgi:hypothetical protein
LIFQDLDLGVALSAEAELRPTEGGGEHPPEAKSFAKSSAEDLKRREMPSPPVDSCLSKREAGMVSGSIHRMLRLVGFVFLFALFVPRSPLHASWSASTPPAVSQIWGLSGLYLTSADDGWAVGYDGEKGTGLLLHYTGGTWISLDASAIIPPEESDQWWLSSVHFVWANEGWAVGTDEYNARGVLLHYSNGSWSSVSPPEVSESWGLSSVHFTTSGEGWAVGKDEANGCGVLLHYSNGSWSSYGASTIISPDTSWEWELSSVHLTSPSQGWAVGYDWDNGQAVLLRYLNGSWTSMNPPDMGGLDWGLSSVHFTSPSEGWAAGWQYDWDSDSGKGVLLRYVNGSWASKSPPKVSSSQWGLSSIHFASSDSGWAVGWRYDWEAMTGGGVILRYDRGPWTVVDPGYAGEDWELRAVHFVSPQEGWAVGAEFGWEADSGILLHYDAPSNQGGADLTGSWNSLSQLCKNGKNGTRCTLKGAFTVRNAGQEATPASSVAFYLSGDESLDPGADVLLKQVSVKKLSPGRSKTAKLKYVLPSGESTSGKLVLACVDPSNAVKESNEDNNVVPSGVLP